MEYEEIDKNCPGPGVSADFLEENLQGCLCEEECSIKKKCYCLKFGQVSLIL